MSYYDWVKNMMLLKESPRDEELINKLEKYTLYDEPYVLKRLTMHALDTLKERLDESGYSCLKHLYKEDLDTLSLDFINLKKEKEYSIRIANLKVFQNYITNLLVDLINEKYEEICKVLRKNLEEIDTSGKYLSTFEKIISNNMEG